MACSCVDPLIVATDFGDKCIDCEDFMEESY